MYREMCRKIFSKNVNSFCLWEVRFPKILLFLSFLSEQHHSHQNSRAIKRQPQGFADGAVVGSLPANAGDTSLSPGPERSHMPRNN